MKEYQTKEIRNIALLGHASTGKTCLAEAMLYTAGNINRLGRINEGNTTSDYNKDEIERKHSLNSTLMYCEHDETKFNLIDNPGYLDFIGEGKASTRVADFGLILVHSQLGTEVGSEVVFNFTKEDNIPAGFVINLLDKEHADFDGVVTQIQKAFGKKAVPLQIPVNQGVDYNTVIDIVNSKLYEYSIDGKGKPQVKEIPTDLKSKIERMHEELLESVAESDDELLEKFFDNGTLTDEEFREGLKKAILSRELFPIFATSAYNNIGVSNMMTLLKDFAPTPDELPALETKEGDKLDIDDESPTSLFVFKTVSELHVGELSLFRIMSGKLNAGTELDNTRAKETEKIGQIYCINGENKQEVAHLHAGDLGTVVKLKYTHTGDTLSTPKNPVVYPPIDFPLPVIRVAVKPKSRADEDKIKIGLQTISDEDPTFHFEYDPEIKQTIISGQGELHLKVILARLKEKFNVEVEQEQPRIPYRETIRKKSAAKYRHKKQTGGAGQFAEVWLKVAPLEHGKGVDFEDSLVGQNVDRVFVPSVEKGVKAACEEGILAGYKVTDVKINFYDGKMHPVDSKDIAFQIAGKEAFKKAFLDSDPILLEPIFDLEIIVPEDFMGDIMSDISTRRGKIEGMGSEGSFQKITAKVPLGELHRYGSALRSMTQGRGLHRQKFSHYESMPRDKQEEVVKESKEKDEKE